MRKPIAWITAAAVSAGLGSCAATPDVATLLPPTVEVASWELVASTPGEARVEGVLVVRNPNDAALPLGPVAYRILAGEDVLRQGRITASGPVPGRGELRLEIAAGLDPPALKRGGGGTELALTGRLRLDEPWPISGVPFATRAVLTLPPRPRTSLKAVELVGEERRMAVRVEIENPGPDDLRLTRIRGRLRVGEITVPLRRWNRGADLPAGKEVSLRIWTAGALKPTTEIVKNLQGREPLEAEVRGTLHARTEGVELKTPFRSRVAEATLSLSGVPGVPGR